ncbi:MAG: hypothetical protein ACRD2Y_08495 [Terriglobales bacterium]
MPGTDDHDIELFGERKHSAVSHQQSAKTNSSSGKLVALAVLPYIACIKGKEQP